MEGAPRALPGEVVPELREMTPNVSDGMLLAEVFSQVLRFFSSPTVTWDTPFVGGETFRELRARLQRFLADLLARGGGGDPLPAAPRGPHKAPFPPPPRPSQGGSPRGRPGPGS